MRRRAEMAVVCLDPFPTLTSVLCCHIPQPAHLPGTTTQTPAKPSPTPLHRHDPLLPHLPHRRPLRRRPKRNRHPRRPRLHHHRHRLDLRRDRSGSCIRVCFGLCVGVCLCWLRLLHRLRFVFRFYGDGGCFRLCNSRRDCCCWWFYQRCVKRDKWEHGAGGELHADSRRCDHDEDVWCLGGGGFGIRVLSMTGCSGSNLEMATKYYFRLATLAKAPLV